LVDHLYSPSVLVEVNVYAKLTMELQDYTFQGVTLVDWSIAVGSGVGIAAVLLIIQRLVASRFKKLAKKTDNQIDDLVAILLKGTRWYAFLAVGIGVAIYIRDFPEQIDQFALRCVFVIFMFQVGLWGSAAISWWVNLYQKEKLSVDPSSVTTIRGMALLGYILLWSVLLLLTLDNFGVDVTALVTGLGIGGIAVALAVQNILGDLFASLSIMLDKPFVIGDFLVIDDYKGTVEDIGLKTTRLRSLSGEQIIISNSDLLKSRIRNYKRMNQRRIAFSIGVEYETDKSLLDEIPGMLEKAVSQQEKVRFDRAHFQSFGDSALLYEVVYFVIESDYALYMDIQQAINLEIVRAFDEKGIGIAYPTQKLFVESQGVAVGSS